MDRYNMFHTVNITHPPRRASGWMPKQPRKTSHRRRWTQEGLPGGSPSKADGLSYDELVHLIRELVIIWQKITSDFKNYRENRTILLFLWTWILTCLPTCSMCWHARQSIQSPHLEAVSRDVHRLLLGEEQNSLQVLWTGNWLKPGWWNLAFVCICWFLHFPLPKSNTIRHTKLKKCIWSPLPRYHEASKLASIGVTPKKGELQKTSKEHLDLVWFCILCFLLVLIINDYCRLSYRLS